MERARRLAGGLQARRRAGDGDLLDLEILVEQVVGVDDEVGAAAAEREAFLQTRVDGHLEREARAAVAERAHGFGTLVETRENHETREMLPVLIASDDPEGRVVRE